MYLYNLYIGPVHCTNAEFKESEDNKVIGDHHCSVLKHKIAHEATTNEMDITIKVHTVSMGGCWVFIP